MVDVYFFLLTCCHVLCCNTFCKTKGGNMKKLNKKTFSLTLDPEVMDRVDEAAQTILSSLLQRTTWK